MMNTPESEADQRTLVSRQFGKTAAAYLASGVHAAGADLERLSRLAQTLQPARVLDLGSGAGHVSYALARGQTVREKSIIGQDPSRVGFNPKAKRNWIDLKQVIWEIRDESFNLAFSRCSVLHSTHRSS